MLEELERVKLAEKEAVQMVERAHEEASILIQKTKEKVEKERKKLIEKEYVKIEEALEQTKNDAAQKARNIIETAKKDATSMKKQLHSRVGSVADEVMKELM